jgi:Holliday junction resolvase
MHHLGSEVDRMGRLSRNKGARGEREAAAELRRLFHVEARRGRQYQGGDDSPDVVAAIPDVHFEVKRTETLRLYGAMQQAIEDSGDKLPVVLHRRNNEPWLAIVRLDDLPQLAVQLYLTLAENN